MPFGGLSIKPLENSQLKQNNPILAGLLNSLSI